MNLFEIPEPTRQIALRPYQEQCLQAVEAGFDSGIRRGLLVLPTGTGKCLGKGTPVMLYDGSVVPVESVRVGMRLMGPDSRPREVVSVCSGVENLYRVVPAKGDSYVVNESHILSLKITRGSKLAKRFPDGSVANIEVRDYLAQSNTFKHCAKGWRAPVEFPRRDVPLDPYILGVWLGDGTSDAPAVTTADPEVVEALKAFCAKEGLRFKEGAHSGKSRTYGIRSDTKGRGHKAWFGETLRSLGLMPDKFVPDLYLRNCRSTRLAILAGLVDTDGYLTTGSYDLVFLHKRLAEGAVYLARTLGLAAYMSECRKTCTNTGATGTYHRVTISGEISMIPCRVARRRAPKRRQIKDPLVTGIRLELLGPGEYFGFELAGPDRLFLLGDCTVTHNTTIFSELVKRRAERSLILAHRTELLDQAAARLRSMGAARFVGVEGGSQRADDGSDVVVAGVQSIGRERTDRLSWFDPRLVIVDEAHHACADSYMTVLRRYGCFGDGARCLGVTATPHRLDNKPLHGTERSIFEAVLFQYTLREAIEASWLCDLRGYRVQGGADLEGVKSSMGDFNAGQLASRVDNPERNVAAFKHWAEVARDRRTVVFCCTVDHALHVAELFQDRGVRAECVHGGMDPEERAGIMGRFRSGETQVLTNVEIVTEGVDVPEIGCVLLLRPTQSWALYTQMVGRGLRPLPDKPDCIVIDVVDASAGKSLASCPGLLGLPPDLDLEGNSLSAAAKRVDQFSDGRKAALFRRPTTFSGLFDELTEVDLLAELAIPEEAAKCSRFGWLKLADDQYRLSCGGDEQEGRRAAVLAVDPLGAWSLRLVSDKRDEAHGLGDDLRNAFRLADALIRQAYPGVSAVADRSAPWRSSPPSEKQLGVLKRFRVQPDVLAALDKGQASQLITKLMAEARR